MQPKTIGERIRALRIKKNLSVAEMSIQIGFPRRYIYFWESGKVKPSCDNIEILCLFFNVSADYLIFG